VLLTDVQGTDGNGEALNLNFSSYNLKGDGVTDDTGALQKLLNDSVNVYLKSGTYIINSTINLKANTKLFGQPGTVIKAGKNMTGTLLTNGRYIFAEKSDYAVIENITFSQSDTPFAFAEWNNSCIFLLNTSNFRVAKCLFDFHLAYNSLGMEAVWISGSGSKNNIILKNQVRTLGVRYAENGADSTSVEANVFTNAYANALSATGNNEMDKILGCKVIDNQITNAGRMGIEDWGNTQGSVIQGNHISGTGKDAKQAVDGIALSAVGVQPAVLKNTIDNGEVYGIEVRGNYGATVSGNNISSNAKVTGIILNYTFPAPAPNLNACVVSGNKISGGKLGLHIFGDYESNAKISGNSFLNVLGKGISIESGAKDYQIIIDKNRFEFSTPNTEDRSAIFTYTKYPPSTANQIVTMSADTINFTPPSASGKGVDFGIIVRTDHTTIENLQLQANGNRNAGGVPVNAITALGAKPVDVTMFNNTVMGGLVDLNGFVFPKLNGNKFSN
ncbi:MAG: hypothetical protein EOP55_19695, partial [Sphingobacteriales bacterium]